MDRRAWLAAGAAALAGCGRKTIAPPAATLRPLAPVRSEVDRIFRITVCARPFRAAGPRMDAEALGDRTVFHHYGHGGSGWSLSWGSGRIVVDRAMARASELNTREVAVIGCGAIGLTSAILLQRAGARVTIYAKERPPDVRSMRATGSWTPDSRVALASAVDASFPSLWERMCRYSFHTYESYLGLAGNPVEWLDRYQLSNMSPEEQRAQREKRASLDFAHYQDRVADLTPRNTHLPPGAHGFPVKHAVRGTNLTFNIAAFAKQLLTEFFIEGGRLEIREFHDPQSLAKLPERIILNCTGYGARALWKDESIIPVRGQIAWLIPQPELNYSLVYDGVYVLARRDGIVVQDGGIGEMEGYNDANEAPDRAAAEAAVRKIGALYEKMIPRRG
jgi:D-amino-acid oxidase